MPSSATFNENFMSFYSALEQTAFGLHEALTITDREVTQIAAVGASVPAANAENDEWMKQVSQGDQGNEFRNDPNQGRLNGLVVFPDSESASATVAKIEKSFSDNVVVTQDKQDPHTGTIVPVFKNEKQTEEYRYVIVPVADPP